MNSFLLISALLIVVVALIHSLVGEKLVVMPILKLGLPPLLGNSVLMEQTLRLAWHIMSLAALGLAAILFFYAFHAITPAESITVKIIAGTFGLSGILAAIITRGRHFSWWATLLIAVLAWMGS